MRQEQCVPHVPACKFSSITASSANLQLTTTHQRCWLTTASSANLAAVTASAASIPVSTAPALIVKAPPSAISSTRNMYRSSGQKAVNINSLKSSNQRSRTHQRQQCLREPMSCPEITLSLSIPSSTAPAPMVKAPPAATVASPETSAIQRHEQQRSQPSSLFRHQR